MKSSQLPLFYFTDEQLNTNSDCAEQFLADFLMLNNQAARLGDLYFETALMQSILPHFYLLAKGEKDKVQFLKELEFIFYAELPFIKSFLDHRLTFESLVPEKLLVTLQRITDLIGYRVLQETPFYRNQFMGQTLRKMSALFANQNHFEGTLQNGKLITTINLYRCFDSLDDIMKLNYQLEKGYSNNSNERLYIGAGSGVQSSFSGILLALDLLKLEPHMRMVDLGSGYGRLGLIGGLLYPECNFLGYEFVSHRVENANNCAESLNLQKNVQFHCQDLSFKDFKMPKADCYYFYDPFSEEVFQSLISQILDYSQQSNVRIITKGNCGQLVLKRTQDLSWKTPTQINIDNISIFSN